MRLSWKRATLVIRVLRGLQGGSVSLHSRPEQIRRVAGASLRRLRTDRIDLFHQSDRSRAPPPRRCPRGLVRADERPPVERGTSYASACGPWPESRC